MNGECAGGTYKNRKAKPPCLLAPTDGRQQRNSSITTESEVHVWERNRTKTAIGKSLPADSCFCGKCGAPAGQKMFEAKALCKSYRGRQVLPPVSFCLPAGQCLGVVGENGSGKSTLLRLLAQIERPDSGDILFQGRSVLRDRSFLRARLGYVPQDNELAPGLTSAQQLKLWQSACGHSGPLPGEIVELLGLAELLPVRTENLSGGMQRRVSIAMALLSRPDILVMDEATTGLDRSYCPQLLDWLEGFLARGGRIVWCSHHADELERLCGSCIRLCGGQQADDP